MINSGKDKVTAHLDKNIISNIIQTARASLKEPSRPFTPSEAQRSLFSNQDSNRPPSSYSIRSLSKDLEPLKQRPLVLDSPICTNRKLMTEESKNSIRQPVKPVFERLEVSENIEEENETISELKTLVCVLEKMKLHSEVRKLYENNDLDGFLNTLSDNLAALKYLENKPKWANCAEVLKSLALTIEAFENDARKVMKIIRCLLENITKHEILYIRKSKTMIMHSLANSAVKVLYQFSKTNDNDEIFLEEKLCDTLYMLLTNIVSEDPYVEIDLPYDFLIFLLGIIKNISNSVIVAESLNNLISPLSSLLPTPLLDSKPHRNSKHSNLLVQVTGTLKNLANKQNFSEILAYQIIEKLTLVLQIYNDQDIILNCVKTISKLSLEEVVCRILQNSMNVYFQLLEKVESPLVLSRCCYVLANIFTVCEDSRNSAEKTSVQVLLIISLKMLGSKEAVNIDLLIKTVRLLANLISAPHIGRSLDCAEDLLRLLIEIITKYNIEEHEELILNTVACITNFLYFDQPNSESLSFNTRLLAFSKLSPLLVTSFNEELTAETLRALGNLTRHETICRELPNLYMLEIFFLLLDHSNWLILYYSLGCLINVSSLTKEFLYSEKNFDVLISMADDIQLCEPELCASLFMILCNLCSPSKGLVP